MKRFNLDDYDAICLFSPIGVRSLVKNFPDIKDRNIIIAAFGASTHAALKENGIKLTIAAPTQVAPSMAMALENHILGRQQGSVISLKSETKRTKGSSLQGSAKHTKPVIANKEVYKKRMEEKKAQAAARRAQRAAERAQQEAAKQAQAEKAAKAEATKKEVEKKEIVRKEPVKKVAVKKAPAKKAPVTKVAAKSTKNAKTVSKK